MKQINQLIRFNRYTISALCLLAIAAITIATVGKHNHTAAAPAVKPAVEAAVQSQFSFSGATDWWQGATNKTSMALFHRQQDGCFTSIEHRTGTIAAGEAAFKKTEANLISNGYIITPGATQTLAIQTSTGPRQYQLEQSSVTTPAGAQKIKASQEFGYVQLANGYLYIQGYCDVPNALPTSIPALRAITFNAAV